MVQLTHVDAFAGIGGFTTAFERAGVKTVAAIENDKYCQQVLRYQFPDVKLFGDIKEVSGDDIINAGFVPERGIFSFGFPCTDISVAGKGGGLAMERSGLFFEAARLLQEMQPKWFVAENVANLLSVNGRRDMGVVTETLVQCGYGISWRILDASLLGVPQRRRRIFIVGHLGEPWTASAEVLFEPEGMPGDSPQGGEAQSGAAGSATEGPGDGRCAGMTSTLLSARLGVPSAEEVAGGQVVVEPIAFHATQDPISGNISPALTSNAYIGVAEHSSTIQGGGASAAIG